MEPIIRPLEPTDDLIELTELVHAAYAPLGALGLNYTGVDQSPEVTADRLAAGEAWVAEDSEGALVATATLTYPDPYDHCVYFRDLSQLTLNQFAVHPAYQGAGLGRRMVEHLCERAKELGYRAVTIDTAIPATHLVEWYARLGFQPIGEVQWEGKTYRSVVMSRLVG